MASKEQKEKTGSDYNDQVIRKAVLATPGVACVQDLPPIHDGIIITNLLGISDVDIFIQVFFGYNIPEVAWNIQENVKDALGREIQLDPNHINIHIEGVDFSNVK